MRRVALEAAPDHVLKLAHEREPIKAVIELIWNALDAEASDVDVALHTGALTGVEGVEVTDNGHGISPDSAETEFKRIGGSWKKYARVSKNKGLPLHGETGQGRLRAFALGTKVRWETFAADSTGSLKHFYIEAENTGGEDLLFSDAEDAETGAETGTIVTASGKQAGYLNQLLDPQTREAITIAFAPYLAKYRKVRIKYQGRAIDPGENEESRHDLSLEFSYKGVNYTAPMLLIEWAKGKRVQQLVLADGHGMPVDEVEVAGIAEDFSFTCYVNWDLMPQHRGDHLLGLQADTPVAALIKAARKLLSRHFEKMRAERGRRQIERWEEEGVYPFSREPSSDAERAERVAFDVVATSIGSLVTGPARRKKLTLSLLKNSMRHNPEDVIDILDAVLKLPPEEINKLRRLLSQSNLSNIIQASAQVTDRLNFLSALENIVYDRDLRKYFKEREHLHKILEREPWVFGEQFNYMISEKGLTAVLETHRKALGLDTPQDSPVTTVDGKKARVDLMFSKKSAEHDRVRHLIVELKAPGVKATEKELGQIRRYALAVAKEPRFANIKTEWNFWLVVSQLDDFVLSEARQKGRLPGIVGEPENIENARITIWVKTWSEIIEECRQRLSFFRDSLQHDPSLEQALDYVRREYNELLPHGLSA